MAYAPVSELQTFTTVATVIQGGWKVHLGPQGGPKSLLYFPTEKHPPSSSDDL